MFLKLVLRDATLLIFTTLLITAVYLKVVQNVIKARKTTGPRAFGFLPLVGHGHLIARNIYRFLTSSYQTCGDFFRIQIFRNKIAVLCDKKYAQAFFLAKEDELSFRGMLDEFNFLDVFDSGRLTQEELLVWIQKHGFPAKPGKTADVVARMEIDAQRLIQRLRETEGQSVNIEPMLYQFVINSTSRVFFGVPLTPHGLTSLRRFTQIIDKMVILAFIFPKWLIRLCYYKSLKTCKTQVANCFLDEIKRYRADKERRDSRVIRAGVDEGFGDEEIGNVIVGLLYASAANTPYAVLNLIGEMARSPTHWEKARQECIRLNWDVKALLASKRIHACTMEAARMCANLLPIMRKVMDHRNSKWSGADFVALSVNLIHRDSQVFSSPENFNPDRFLGNERESFQSIYTWGGGPTLCPGKRFSQWEMKVVLIYLLRYLELQEDQCRVSEPNYNVPAAVVNRNVELVYQIFREKKE